MPLINYIGNRQECIGSNAGRGDAPPPPSLNIEYLIVAGGGSSGGGNNGGGSAGGVLSGSTTVAWNTSVSIFVGSGSVSSYESSQSSSISSSTFGYINTFGVAPAGNSGNNFSVGLTGPGFTGGGGGGANGDGQDGNIALNGSGGIGLPWVNGLWYGGGGGGQGGSPPYSPPPGFPGLGGGGTALTNGQSDDGLPYQLAGYNGRGGGAAGFYSKGGDGTVIIRYSTGSLRMGDGGTEYQSGGYYYHEFGTGSSLFRYQYEY